MARGEMLVVFTYDITKAKRRRKMAMLLEDVATRVQKSVFEARLNRAKADAICKRATNFLDSGDSLRVYCIGADGIRRSRLIGDGPPFEPEGDYWLV